MLDVNEFDYIKIGIASPEMIRRWSNGEVKKPETINYRTLKPEKDGLFCEKIFGPTKDWECYCGKYKRVRFKGIICERCGVEVTRSKVRRDRMGHIELVAPVAHIWYFKGIPSRMGYLLDIRPRDIEKVLYFSSYMVTDVQKEKIKEDLKMLTEEIDEEIQDLEKERDETLKAEVEKKEQRIAVLKGEAKPEKGEEVPKTDKKQKAEIKKIQNEIKKATKSIKNDYKQRIEWVKYVFTSLKGLQEQQIINDEQLYYDLRTRYDEYFSAAMGADAFKVLLAKVDLKKEAKDLKDTIKKSTGQKQKKAIKRLKVVYSFKNSDNNPEWMIMEAVPVIPPDLRPMVQLDGGRFATSDLNDLYRRVINRNNRLKRLLDLGAPEIIVNNEKRMLQEAVDALFDNGRRGRPVTGPGNRPLKSLSDMLKGKQGRFRQNLLGKRVDYSGRSVIVIGPNLKLHQCGLPKVMALELFKPFVMKRLVDLGHAQNIKSAKRIVERQRSVVWDILEEVIKDHPVLLNRAPTLHRLGIQAFEPVLVEGKAIQIHPMVTTAFNADFDGDQMAVHLPLSAEAQAEARILMLSSNNILSPAHGRPLVAPTQDLVLGAFYLTADKGETPKDNKWKYFADIAEIYHALENNTINIHTKIKYRKDGELIETSPGQIIFNEILPKDFGFVTDEVDKSRLRKIVEQAIRRYSTNEIQEFLDRLKEVTLRYATLNGLTIGIDDIAIPENKWKLLDEPEERVDEIEKQYRRGLITDDERHQQVVDVWTQATEMVSKAMEDSFEKFNPISMMANSGARGNIKQIRQLAAMRGLVANPKGDIIDRPIKANFREGLTVLEYFISTHGARKGLADTALRTADSGYLTRRLVDVSQDVIIREKDCKTKKGIEISILRDGKPNDNVIGRYTLKKVKDSKGKVLLQAKEEITEEVLDELAEAKIEKIEIRSVLGCEAKAGICSICYGWSLSDARLVDIGMAVGIIAAQSIGEPGTQLTMRTFHTGGVAGEDITHGLPRVVELFEARRPKGQSLIAEISGKVKITESEDQKIVTIVGKKTEKNYEFPRRMHLTVKKGEEIEAGTQLTDGSINTHDLLKIKGVKAVQQYLLQEVQEVYRSQGVDINDKHVELIIKQMLRRVTVSEAGDTDLLPGQMVEQKLFQEENEKVIANGGTPATAKQTLLGITKASLATESFLSAASFQETTRVLTDAVISGREDPLIGLKENVIIGKLIPAATGMNKYRKVKIKAKGEIPIPPILEEETSSGEEFLSQNAELEELSLENQPDIFDNSEADNENDSLSGE